MLHKINRSFDNALSKVLSFGPCFSESNNLSANFWNINSTLCARGACIWPRSLSLFLSQYFSKYVSRGSRRCNMERSSFLCRLCHDRLANIRSSMVVDFFYKLGAFLEEKTLSLCDKKYNHCFYTGKFERNMFGNICLLRIFELFLVQRSNPYQCL